MHSAMTGAILSAGGADSSDAGNVRGRSILGLFGETQSSQARSLLALGAASRLIFCHGFRGFPGLQLLFAKIGFRAFLGFLRLYGQWTPRYLSALAPQLVIRYARKVRFATAQRHAHFRLVSSETGKNLDKSGLCTLNVVQL